MTAVLFAAAHKGRFFIFHYFRKGFLLLLNPTCAYSFSALFCILTRLFLLFGKLYPLTCRSIMVTAPRTQIKFNSSCEMSAKVKADGIPALSHRKTSRSSSNDLK